MGTIEKRALDATRKAMLRWHTNRTTVNGTITSVNKPDYMDGYTDGATEQRKIDIEKACEWLYNDLSNLSEHIRRGIVRDFRKAMEE